MKANPMAFIAKHKIPFLVVGGVVVGYIVLKNIGGGSSSTTTTGTDPNATAAAVAMAQITAQQQSQAAAAAAAVSQQQFQLAGLQEQGTIQTTQQVNQINGNIQLATIQAHSVDLQTTAQTQ